MHDTKALHSSEKQQRKAEKIVLFALVCSCFPLQRQGQALPGQAGPTDWEIPGKPVWWCGCQHCTPSPAAHTCQSRGPSAENEMGRAQGLLRESFLPVSPVLPVDRGLLKNTDTHGKNGLYYDYKGNTKIKLYIE